MEIAVTRGVVARLLAEAEKAAPLECCGLLTGRAGIIESALPAANVSPQPAIRFEIDPVVLLGAHREARSGGPAVIGYYHSHPTGHPTPSATDCEHSTGDLRVWAIVAGGEVAFWRDTGNGFAPLSCRIVDG